MSLITSYLKLASCCELQLLKSSIIYFQKPFSWAIKQISIIPKNHYINQISQKWHVINIVAFRNNYLQTEKKLLSNSVKEEIQNANKDN